MQEELEKVREILLKEDNNLTKDKKNTVDNIDVVILEALLSEGAELRKGIKDLILEANKTFKEYHVDNRDLREKLEKVRKRLEKSY